MKFTMKSKIKRAFKRVGRGLWVGLIWLIDWLVPKNRNCIIVGSDSGRSLSGNSRVIFEALKTEGKYKVYYSSRETKGDEAAIRHGRWRDLAKYLRAKVFIMSHGPWDINSKLWPARYKRNRFLVQTWHGTPIKGLSSLDNTLSDREKRQDLRINRKYHIFLTTSDLFSYIFAAISQIPVQNMRSLGYPRNDPLFDQRDRDHVFRSYFKHLPAYEKVALYAPTFREFKDVEFFPFRDFDPAQLQTFLEKSRLIIFLRKHSFNRLSCAKKSAPRVIILDSSIEPDINNILNCFDFIITDYSSLYIDYLLLNRPIIFLPYDFDEYVQTRGLLFDYESITPGDKVLNFSEFLQGMQDIVDGNDKHRARRELLAKLFHNYSDGNSTRRFIEMLTEEGILPDIKSGRSVSHPQR
jgi:CDP-glycerol glycerophosphotransferase (TagB/SpsB family)